MNKKQIEYAEYKLTKLSRDIEKQYDRIERREMSGDIEKLARANTMLVKLKAELKGMLEMLCIIGYCVDWEIGDDYDIAHIKREREE